jgi:hypothetical protein
LCLSGAKVFVIMAGEANAPGGPGPTMSTGPDGAARRES